MKEDESTKMKNAEASSPGAPSTRAQALDSSSGRESESIYPIAALTFRVAKTMSECPHEYAVKSPANEQEYVRPWNTRKS